MDSAVATTALFLRESIAACWEQATDLIALNNAETGYIAPDVSPESFTPNPEFYFDLEERGFTRLFTMRHEGKLTGYQVFMLGPHPRHPGRIFAMQDTFFVEKAHRGIEVSHFMCFADGELKREGYKRLRNFKPENDLSRLYTHHGYIKLEETWVSVD